MTSLAGYFKYYLMFLHDISKSPISRVLGVSLRTRDKLHSRLVPGGCFTIFYNPLWPPFLTQTCLILYFKRIKHRFL